jgi:hypothetical protein
MVMVFGATKRRLAHDAHCTKVLTLHLREKNDIHLRIWQRCSGALWHEQCDGSAVIHQDHTILAHLRFTGIAMASITFCSTERNSPQLQPEGTKPRKRTSFFPVDQRPVKVPQCDRPMMRPFLSNSIVNGGTHG